MIVMAAEGKAAAIVAHQIRRLLSPPSTETATRDGSACFSALTKRVVQ